MKNIALVNLMLVLLMFLAACSAAEGTGSEGAITDLGGVTVVQASADTVDKATVANCPEPGPAEHQLVYAAEGICFLYPENYDVVQGQDGSLTLYVRSVLNTEAPLAMLRVSALEGRTIQEVVPDYPSEAELAVISLEAIDLGEETATVLNNMPGQDVNRRIIAVHDGKLYDLMIARIGDEYGVVGQEAEELYKLITGSFQFIGYEPDAPLQAGPECPEAIEGTTLYTNDAGGYCLLLPDGYLVDDRLGSEESGAEAAVYVDSLQDVTHARLFIAVEDVGARSLEDITTNLEAEIETAIPGYDVIWSFGYMLDGVFANQFDQVPGQDLSRQVIMVRNGRQYTLAFTPDDPGAAGAYAEMQTLYDTVMDSFSFRW